jgi:hypothetical protein
MSDFIGTFPPVAVVTCIVKKDFFDPYRKIRGQIGYIPLSSWWIPFPISSNRRLPID